MSATDLPFERLEALLRGDEPRTLEEKQRASMLAELRAGELGAPDTLRQRVLAAGQAGRRRHFAMPRGRRLVLVVVPVAACLAVGAALIHGAFSSSNNRIAGTGVPGPVRAALAPKKEAKQRTLHGGTSGKTLDSLGKATSANVYDATVPAKNQAFGAQVQGNLNLGISSAASGTAAITHQYSPVTIPTNRLVHADASLQVVVANHGALTRATNRASQIAASLGGYAQSVQYQTSRKGVGNAYLDLRIPVDKAETAIGKFGALGKLVSQQVATQDLQQQFRQQTTTIGSLKREIAIYEQALNSGSVTGAQRVEVQIRLSNADHSLTALRKARSHTVASAATADIQLQLTTDQHAFAAVHHKQGRLGRLLGNAGSFLGLEGIIVLYVLIVAAPFVILIGLGWGLARERRRRDERRLLASS